VEYSRLAGQVAEIEKLMQSGARSDAGYLLAPFLENARSRMDVIRFEETRFEQEKKESKEKENATVAAMVEREHNLNAQEKEQFGEFLKMDHFTRESFGKLSEFYADGGAWDRLSENGKSEMSHRVWEGIRQDEYTFGELPENVRKKESERLYQQLTGKTQADPGLDNLPQQDRADFIREHEAGNEKAASQVLSRESFSKNVSTHSSKEVSKMDTSSTTRTTTDEKNPDVNSAIKAKEETALEGVTFAAAGSLPPTQLPPASGGSIEKS
jgi:hypothetical protein